MKQNRRFTNKCVYTLKIFTSSTKLYAAHLETFSSVLISRRYTSTKLSCPARKVYICRYSFDPTIMEKCGGESCDFPQNNVKSLRRTFKMYPLHSDATEVK